MTLAEYTERRGSIKALVVDSGVTESHLYKIRKGELIPGVEVAIQIEMATGGKVRAESMLSPKSRKLVDYLRRNP